MTLEEKIDAFVLAQGNQVGAGAELAGILKEIAGGMINVPTITQEELNSGVLTQERYDEIANSGIIRVNGDLCVICSDAETTGNFVEQCQGIDGVLFTYCYGANSNGLNMFCGYLFYTTASQPDKRFISYVDI